MSEIFVEIDKKRLKKAFAQARRLGVVYKELALLFAVAPSVTHKWANYKGRCHKERIPQFEAFYKWVEEDSCPGLDLWREHNYAQEHNPAKMKPVPVMGRKPSSSKSKSKPKRKYTRKGTPPTALTTVVDSLELDLEEFLHSEQKLRAQHALEFAARKAGIALPKATRFAVLLVAGLQSGGVLHTQDFSSLLK